MLLSIKKNQFELKISNFYKSVMFYFIDKIVYELNHLKRKSSMSFLIKIVV